MSVLKEADHRTAQNLPNSLVQDVVLIGDSLTGRSRTTDSFLTEYQSN